MNLEDLLIKIRCKQFSQATADIKNVALKKHEALLVLYEISNMVMYKQILTDDEKLDFVSLLKGYKNRTSHLINDYKDNEIVKYYNCMHYVVKYVTSDCSIAELLDLRELILLHPQQVNMDKTASLYYTGTYSLIFKVLMEVPKLKHDVMIELILLQCEMRLANADDFNRNIPAIFSLLCNINISLEMQLNCLSKILLMGFPPARKSENQFYYSAILSAFYYICQTAKKEAYKIDLGIIIVLLNPNSRTCEVSAGIVDIMKILNLEDIKFLPDLKNALKIDTLKNNNIRDAQIITDVYCFVMSVMQTWIFSETTKHHISECITDLMEIVETMQKHFITNMKVCQCCSMKIDLINSFQLFSTTLELLKHSRNVSNLIELFDPIYYIVTDVIVQLKLANCNDFDRYWSKCSSFLSSVGCALLAENNSDGARFLLLLMKQIGIFGFSNSFVRGTLYFIHNLLSFFKDQKDHKKLMIFSAIAIYIDTTNADKILPQYCHSLYSLNLLLPEEERLYGIVDVLMENMQIVKEYVPTLNKRIDRRRSKELLQQELNFYLKKWQCKTYIVNVLKQLAKFSSKSLITSILVENYTIFVNVDCDMVTLLQNLLNELKQSNLSSAVLHYLIANNMTYTLIQKNKIDMNNTIVTAKVEYSQYEPAPDPNDICDIVSTYSSLNLKNHKIILTHLKSALADIGKCYAEDSDLTNLGRGFELCSKLAHYFRLHCNFTYSEFSWNLAKNIASKLNDNLKLLDAVGWLLHKADTNESMLRLLELGNSVANKLSAQENSLSLMWYHLHISNFYLQNCQGRLALEEYKIICNLMEFASTPLKDDITGFALQFEFLKSTISRIPCETALDKPHNPELLPKKALKMLLNYMNKIGYGKMETYHLTTYFEELDDVLMRFSLMRLPREIRLYGKDVAILSQKLVLSIRTARMLTHLARADILSCNVNDCQIKLDGIADILNLPIVNTKLDFMAKELSKEDYNEIIECKLADQIRDMQLNIPQTSSLSGSPTFRKKIYNLPFFINHVINCDCYECTSPEYAILILGKLHIDFLLFETELALSMSQVIHEMFLKVYNFLMSREIIIKQNVTKNYKKVYNETYAFFLLDYLVKSNLIFNDLNLAKEINKQIVDLVKGNKRHDSDLLLHAAYAQRSLLLLHEKLPKKSDVKNSNETNDCETQPIEKTPENKVYPNKSVEDKLLLSTFVIERRLKNIPFNLSDEDGESKSNPPIPKTPKPTFRIFDDKSRPSTRRKIEQSTLNTAFCYPTTSSSKLKERTAQKTKMLTEKLRKSAKKVQSDSGDSCSEAAADFTKPKRIVRKKLLNELKECEQTPKLNARKSAYDLDSEGIRRSGRRK